MVPTERLIPAPPGTTLVHLPGRLATGADAAPAVSGRLAVAAVLPPCLLYTSDAADE